MLPAGASEADAAVVLTVSVAVTAPVPVIAAGWVTEQTGGSTEPAGPVTVHRTREIGIRVALGSTVTGSSGAGTETTNSTRAGILRLVLREGLELVVIGLVFGIVGAASLQKVVATEIYGVRPLDPFVLASVMVLLAIVTLAACVVPARRAMRVEPTVALRYE